MFVLPLLYITLSFYFLCFLVFFFLICLFVFLFHRFGCSPPACSRVQVEAFLSSLPLMFQRTVDVEAALGPALEAAALVRRDEMRCDEMI